MMNRAKVADVLEPYILELKVQKEWNNLKGMLSLTPHTQFDLDAGWPLRRIPWHEEGSRSLLVSLYAQHPLYSLPHKHRSSP